MAELVDALDSKSGCSNTVRVQVPSRPPTDVNLTKIIKYAIMEIYDLRGRFFIAIYKIIKV